MNQNTGWSSNGYSNIQKMPLYTTRNGLFSGGGLSSQASYGNLWSGTTLSDTSAYRLGYGSGYVYPAGNYNRQNGFPVRCINRDFNFLLVQYGIAVNYVGVDSNATWATSGYNDVQANPIYTPRSGNGGGGSFDEQASNGYLWSDTTYSGTRAYNLRYNSSDVNPAYSNSRYLGFPVRCIAYAY